MNAADVIAALLFTWPEDGKTIAEILSAIREKGHLLKCSIRNVARILGKLMLNGLVARSTRERPQLDPETARHLSLEQKARRTWRLLYQYSLTAKGRCTYRNGG